MARDPVNDGTAASTRRELATQLGTLPAFRAFLRTAEVRLIRSAAPLATPLLDLGCGDGEFAGRAFTRRQAGGLDPALRALVEQGNDGPLRWRCNGDGAALPFRSGAIQTVVANSVLEHVEGFSGALDEIARVLAPGGTLLVTSPGERFAELLAGSTLLRGLRLPRLAARYGDWFNRHSRHFQTLSEDQWRQHLERRGLRVARSHGYFSARAHRRFDLLHYLGLPALLLHQLTGRWVLWRNPVSRWVALRWLTAHADGREHLGGAYVFVIARKASAS